MATIVVNSEPVQISAILTVADLLRERRFDRTPCAVEVNRVVVPRRLHAEQMLRDGDVVEIVTLVGGG